MTFDPLAPTLLLTADLPGLAGRIKSQLEDFEVEEIPAYEPSGEGGFLYLWIEKRGLGAEYFVRQVARRLDIPTQEVGTAGLKDRHAVTRQMVSVPIAVESNLSRLDGEHLEVSRPDIGLQETVRFVDLITSLEAFAAEVRSFLLAACPALATDELWHAWFAGDDLNGRTV